MTPAENLIEQAIGEALAAITAALDRRSGGADDLTAKAYQPSQPVLAFAAAAQLAAQFAAEAGRVTGTTAETVVRRKALRFAGNRPDSARRPQ